MKSKLVFMTVFLLVFCINAYGIEVSVPQLSAAPGDIITVEITVDDTTGIAAGDLKLVYDPVILAAKEVRATDLAAGLTVVSNIDVAGEVIVSMLSVTLTGLPAGTGALLEVDFEAIAGGDSPLTLAEASFSDETAADIPTTAVDGSVTVQAAEDPKAIIMAVHQATHEALNAHDVDLFQSYQTDDAVWDYVPVPMPMTKEETKVFFGELFQGFPDFSVAPGRVLVSGNILVEEHEVAGTHLGEWSGIPATGNTIQFPHIDIVEYEADKVKRITTYIDLVTLMVQLGVMPAPELDPALLVPSFTLPDPEPTGLAPLEAAQNAVSVWNTHDLESNAKQIRPDADIMLAPLGIPMDRDAYIAAMEFYFLTYSDIQQEFVRMIDMGDGWVVAEVVFKATNDGPYFGIPATGNTVETRGAWTARYDADGLVTNLYVYWDELTLLAQLGLFPPPVPPVDTEANKAIVVRAWEEVFNQGNLDAADELFAEDYVYHGVPELHGPEALKQQVAMLRAAFPDFHVTVDDVIAEGDKVVTRCTITGTHQGEFMGIPPTGAQVTVTLNLMSRIADGKIVEDWSNTDTLGLMQQIGVMPLTREDYDWGAPSEVTGEPGDPEANKAIVLGYVEEVWNQKNLDVLDELMIAEVINHDPVLYPGEVDLESHKQVVAMYLAAFPDLYAVPEDIIAEEDKVVVRGTVTGTHQAELMGVPASGNQAVWTDITIFRFADGKMVELWWAYDALGMMQQITPTVPPEKDYTNVFFMSLAPGLNMISLPLEPIEPYTARSFAEYIGATVVIRYDEVLKKYQGFALNAPADGFAIEGGKGYIVNAPEGGVVAFTGAAWTNEPPVEMEAAPPVAQSGDAWAFLVGGWVLDGEGMSIEDGSYVLTAKNLRTGATVTETVGTSGYSAPVWADLSRRAVIQAGDEVEVAVMDNSGRLASGPFVHEVTLDEIRNALLDVRLRLGHIIPEKSALLQNYPNPFNPETWIPFHLSDEASVFIRIYNAVGQLVRTLDLGHRDAGVYVSRSEAAYWDGKNEAGEAVASGIYFYSITAGDFSATRKMVIRK